MKKPVLVFFICLMACSAQAQDNNNFNFTFNHLALSVKDVDSAVAFYKKVMNLQEITNRTKMEGIRWISLGEGKELHLISVLKQPFTINKAIHIGLATSNFDAFVARLDRLKVVYSDWPGVPSTITKRADGVKQIYFQDPDSHWIEVNNIGQQ